MPTIGPRRRGFRKTAATVLVSVVAVVSIALPVSAGSRADRGGVPKRVLSQSTALLQERADKRLLTKLDGATTKKERASETSVLVLASKSSKPPAHLIQPLRMRLHGVSDREVWVGRVRLDRLVKLATAEGVEAVRENGARTPPVVPDVPDAAEKKSARRPISETRDRLARADRAGAGTAFARRFTRTGELKTDTAGSPTRLADGSGGGSSSSGGGAPAGWFDVSPVGHNSAGAWADGYTGQGVRVAVSDDGCDMGHPELQSSFTTMPAGGTPYGGWPMAFDPLSLLLYTYDGYYGTGYVKGGHTWFSDTSSTVTPASPSFDGKTFALPGTSKSGSYRIGKLWDENFEHTVGDFPYVLVADVRVSGVYDTVYVDLDRNYDFTTDKPCTKQSPVSWADLWDGAGGSPGDGIADLSGGMVYWIADGAHHPPGFDFLGFDVSFAPPRAGGMVSFMGALDLGDDHGTLCASNVVGKGIIDGPSWDGRYPSFKTPTGGGTGIVQGAAKGAGLVPIGNIYSMYEYASLAAYDYAAFGLDGLEGTGDEIDVMSNSHGSSDVDNDEWDFVSRYLTLLNTEYSPRTAFLFATGNGAPGYGTNTAPSPSTGINVGASTQMGACGGWDSIAATDQVTVGDVIPWSNRGPTSMGRVGPHVVADGAYSSGAVPVNEITNNGWTSWEIWGGTSRSTPVAAGNLALVYQAYKANHGVFPDWKTARQLLMNGARDISYDSLVQGAGMVDAGRSVRLASESEGLEVAPSDWYPGGFEGTRHEAFANILNPGESDASTLTITNHGGSPVTVALEDAWYVRDSVATMTVTLDGAKESPYSFSRPDYLFDLTSLIPSGTDLMVVRTAEPFDRFAPSSAFDTGSSTHNVARLLVYDWTDRNVDGKLWNDANANGFVNVGEIETVTAGFGEYMRFSYDNNFGNTHEVRVQNPLDRMHDGVWLGLQHSVRHSTSPTLPVAIEVSFWNRADSSWLSAGAGSFGLGTGASRDVTVAVSVPATASPGVYQAQYRVADGARVTVVPVVVSVASPSAHMTFGGGLGSPGSLMDNGTLLGAQSWSWRAESGDWRFYSAEASASLLPPGAAWLVRTSWPSRSSGVKSDLDTLVFGRASDGFVDPPVPIFGPYTLEPIGGSANTNISKGIWTFQTSTGTTEEWVTAPIEGGLQQLAIHNVLYDGRAIGTTFTGEAGVIGADPASLEFVSSATTGSAQLTFTTLDMGVDGLSTCAYGLTKRFSASAEITTGGSWTRDTTLTGAAYLDATLSCEDSDVDLYVSRWTGSSWSLVGASESASGDERVKLVKPTNGLYRVEVYGYDVPVGTDTFDISISAPQGSGVTISGVPAGPLPPGGTADLDVSWSQSRPTLTDREGAYDGVVEIGPPQAPCTLEVPVTLRYPFETETTTPTPGTKIGPQTPIAVRFSKRVDASSLSSSSFYVAKGAEKVPATISYDASSAVATLTVTSGLQDDTSYTVHLAGVRSADGDTLSGSWSLVTDYMSRVSGSDRYATAIAVSEANFTSADTVILATGAQFADALSAAGLAGSYDAPLLLTSSTSLYPGVATRIQQLGASTVLLVGGNAALSATVESAVGAIPGVTSVRRVAGGNRFTTAIAVANAIKAHEGGAFSTTAFLARGDGFADALAITPYAYSQAMPILLTMPTSMPQATRDAIGDLGLTGVVVAGGESAVSSGQLTGIPVVHRAAGGDRYSTAVEVATYCTGRGWGTFTFVGVATGASFPDALGGGVATGANGGVLLMTQPQLLPGPVFATMEARAREVREVQVFGGTKAVSDSVIAALTAAIQ